MTLKIALQIVIGISIFCFPFSAIAQEAEQDATSNKAEEAEEEKKKEVEILETGVIASFGNFPKTKTINVNTTGAAAGSSAAPIHASVKRIDSDTCNAVVTNHSEESSYSVSFEVQGFKKNGNRTFKRGYSARLAPGQSTTKQMKCKKDVNMQVVLKSGKSVE